MKRHMSSVNQQTCLPGNTVTHRPPCTPPTRLHPTNMPATTPPAGYLRLHTSLGDLNIELHCDLAPRTCENFLGLCEMGYYTDTIFHRSIKNFMIQVGWLCVCVGGVWWVRGWLRGLGMQLVSPAPSPHTVGVVDKLLPLVATSVATTAQCLC